MAKTSRKLPGQSQRFVTAARELGTDESEEAFDRVLRKVGSAKPTPHSKEPAGTVRATPKKGRRKR